MTSKYFDSFPIVNYNGFNIVDITVSAKLIDKYVNAPYVYTMFEIDREERADNVANSFYDDQYMTWIIYYANKIIDPYYDWYLSEDDFTNYINMKYGSIDIAQRTILKFVTNWFNDTRELSPLQYDSSFGQYKGIHSNYWKPVFDDNSGAILYYIRNPKNVEVNVNNIVKVTVNSSTGFVNDDLITIKQAINGYAVGAAQVESVIGTSIILKNVMNNIGNNYFLVKDNGTNCQITAYSAVQDYTAPVWTHMNISSLEYVYWTPLTAYDLERELNNYKKTIKLVSPSVALSIANSLKEELNAQ